MIYIYVQSMLFFKTRTASYVIYVVSLKTFLSTNYKQTESNSLDAEKAVLKHRLEITLQKIHLQDCK